ncbi:ketoreductase [Streptomyces davaonensis JCM 4913]|uniref:Ketoreductase n=1 Tax=Streptomyces davaonensis (strain DSM 101723 / JCM 4913 / KCC S-0913 / 768) TaxID=1214101 RepID=K4QTR2_STRDJ|nr:SDR family oxidoreductase [Streptomyces davaonensis]CCK26846.1 ketoreductase [Streptomyces davaonensis JCM 4913]
MTYPSGEEPLGVSRFPAAGAPVALVTECASGIGEAVARRLAAEGLRVVVNCEHSARTGERLAAELPEAMCFAADTAVREQAEALVAAVVERYGRLDVLVNSAGVTQVPLQRDGEAADAEVLRKIFDVHVLGTWQMCVAAMPLLRAGGDGCVVNVSTVTGVRPAAGSVPYAVSRAALDNITRLLAAVTGPEVRVHALAPGPPDASALHHPGTPEEVAEAVLAMVRSHLPSGQALTPLR